MANLMNSIVEHIEKIDEVVADKENIGKIGKYLTKNNNTFMFSMGLSIFLPIFIGVLLFFVGYLNSSEKMMFFSILPHLFSGGVIFFWNEQEQCEVPEKKYMLLVTKSLIELFEDSGINGSKYIKKVIENKNKLPKKWWNALNEKIEKTKLCKTDKEIDRELESIYFARTNNEDEFVIEMTNYRENNG